MCIEEVRCVSVMSLIVCFLEEYEWVSDCMCIEEVRCVSVVSLIVFFLEEYE